MRIRSAYSIVHHDDWKLRYPLLILLFYEGSSILRVAVRCVFDGAPFRWSFAYDTVLQGKERLASIGGAGMDGHFLVLLNIVLLLGTILGLGIRRPHALFGWLLVCYTGLEFWSEMNLALGLGTAYIVQKATLGLVLPNYILGPAVSGLLFLLSVVWLVRFSRGAAPAEPVPWVRGNTRLLVAALAITPATFYFLRFGEQHGPNDVIGLVLLYTQLITLLAALLPRRPRESVPSA